MTNLPNLSPRARKALDVLADGGQFRDMLETNSYTGRTQFRMRLTLNGQTVRGFGHSAFHELNDKGFLRPASATTVSSYYKLNTGE